MDLVQQEENNYIKQGAEGLGFPLLRSTLFIFTHCKIYKHC